MKKTLVISKYVLTDEKLNKYMGKKYFKQYISAKQTGEKLSHVLAENLASAIKKWAIKHGATHFTHWFFPLNNAVAEKYVNFTESDIKGNSINTLSGKTLLQSQADASSFLDCETCTTHKACGYVVCDFSSQIFIKQNGDLKVLYIPSVFYSYHGLALDYKIPLLRSCKILSKNATEFLHLMGNTLVTSVESNLGCEQEYFLIDKNQVNNRTDLLIVGQTLFGAKYNINLKQKNNYYKPFNNSLNNFMAELSAKLYDVGILAKLMHSEVSPKQYEVVPVYSPSNISADQNMLLLKILNEVAEKYNFKAILSEKPFAGINGSGKHNNWSMATNSGLNLLDLTKTSPLVFLCFFTSVLSAVDKHYNLLMAAVTTLENSFRLGGHEAPPTTFSVYIGDAMKNALLNYLKTGKFCVNTTSFIPNKPISFSIKQEPCNRNRTSTFAFTGNKFEFRAVGANQNVMLVNTILNTIVAAELDEINNSIKTYGQTALDNIIKNNIKKHLRIVYNYNCYSAKWQKIANGRGIKNYQNNPNIYESFLQKETVQLFENLGVYNKPELQILQQTLYKNYYTSATNMANTFCHMLSTQILPALQDWQKHICEQIVLYKYSGADYVYLINQQKLVNDSILALIKGDKDIHSLLNTISNIGNLKQQCQLCYQKLLPLLDSIRKYYDDIEPFIPKIMLPMPTYRDILMD